MLCSSCSKELLDSANFCAYCGTQVDTSIQAAQKPTDNDAPSKIKAAYTSVEQAAKKASTVVAGVANTVAIEIGDLNGDGKIDAEDFKIAAATPKVQYQFSSVLFFVRCNSLSRINFCTRKFNAKRVRVQYLVQYCESSRMGRKKLLTNLKL